MIETATQKGPTVYIYGNGNRLLFTRVGSLYGYTGTTVTVKNGSVLYTYNDKGSVVSTKIAN